jgi:hypothetical protein
VSLVGVIIVTFAHTIARVVEGIEIGAGRGAAFGMGIAALFLPLFPLVGAGLLFCLVVAAATVGLSPP